MGFINLGRLIIRKKLKNLIAHFGAHVKRTIKSECAQSADKSSVSISILLYHIDSSFGKLNRANFG